MKTSTRLNLASLVEELGPIPKVYLGGKIREDCWRHLLLKGLRDHKWINGPLSQQGFDYVGPFFVRCGHGCYHHPNKHGAINGCWPDYDQTREEVLYLCTTAIDKADLVFCYIDRVDCFGTLAEIGYAYARGKHIVIAFAPNLVSHDNNDIWFPSQMANKIHFNICLCQLSRLFQKTLRELP